ncbi:hypothetical protein D9757_007969 [Collybiopsis confluens]|uniref:SGNH hydrolase-type esterase domain-containing protein n=1 Tax=Collybiopsis confluens TaxID=2823264 RepID=A0A8H5HBU3_9AGAR|nr:hypothetical protein D9757_007969 [Collybiopsis confluens]
MSINLGPHTTAPLASVGVSLDYGSFTTINVSQGLNNIVGPTALNIEQTEGKSTSVVRLNVEGWQNNRINLESVLLNSVCMHFFSQSNFELTWDCIEDAKLLPYTPLKLAFQFVGDSLSAGQFLPEGVDQAWPFLTGERFRAEHNVNAQPGAALTTDTEQTEDTGYFYTTDHNFTTPWDFQRDQPPPTHVVIHIGANDAAQNVSDTEFVQVYTNFLIRLRNLYPHQPVFVFTPWGWPSADGSISQYYQGQYQIIVEQRHKAGDEQVFLVNTTGWVTWEDVFPE